MRWYNVLLPAGFQFTSEQSGFLENALIDLNDRRAGLEI